LYREYRLNKGDRRALLLPSDAAFGGDGSWGQFHWLEPVRPRRSLRRHRVSASNSGTHGF